MTDRPNRRILRIGELGRRLIIAFVGVAAMTAVAVIVVASLTVKSDIQKFVHGQETRITTAVATVARRAYDGHGTWNRERLRSAIDTVNATDAEVVVHDMAGNVVAASPGAATVRDGARLSAPVMASRVPAGSVTLTFSHNGFAAAEGRLEAERWHARLYAAAIALFLALGVSVVVSRRISAPLERMLAAMRARAAGDRGVRIADTRSVGVLRELLEGFNDATDALDRRDRAQRNLIASVAHELRTPVAILQAGHEAMLDGITEPTMENLGSLRDEVLRLSRILEDVRELASAEAAALQLRLIPNNLADIAANTADRLSEAFEMAGIALHKDLSAVAVLCDDDRVREVVTNLLTNSLKYTPRGGFVVIETGIDGEQARLRVRDSGIGIPPDELPHVTERFFRGRQSADMATGTGLGLTIIKELVAAHHGSISITSEPGCGTQTAVTFPRATNSPNADEMCGAVPPGPAGSHLSGRRVSV